MQVKASLCSGLCSKDIWSGRPSQSPFLETVNPWPICPFLHLMLPDIQFIYWSASPQTEDKHHEDGDLAVLFTTISACSTVPGTQQGLNMYLWINECGVTFAICLQTNSGLGDVTMPIVQIWKLRIREQKGFTLNIPETVIDLQSKHGLHRTGNQ